MYIYALFAAFWGIKNLVYLLRIFIMLWDCLLPLPFGFLCVSVLGGGVLFGVVVS